MCGSYIILCVIIVIIFVIIYAVSLRYIGNCERKIHGDKSSDYGVRDFLFYVFFFITIFSVVAFGWTIWGI